MRGRGIARGGRTQAAAAGSAAPPELGKTGEGGMGEVQLPASPGRETGPQPARRAGSLGKGRGGCA